MRSIHVGSGVNPLVLFEYYRPSSPVVYMPKRNISWPTRSLIIHNGECRMAALYGYCLGLVGGTSDGHGFMALYFVANYVNVLLHVIIFDWWR